MTTTACSPNASPARLPPLLGGRVEQYYALVDPVPASGKWGSGESPALGGAAQHQGRRHRSPACSYGKSNGWLDGQPAAITRKVGKGRITYIGAWLDPATLAQAAKWMTDDTGFRLRWPGVPARVSTLIRADRAHGVVYILINFAEASESARLRP